MLSLEFRVEGSLGKFTIPTGFGVYCWGLKFEVGGFLPAFVSKLFALAVDAKTTEIPLHQLVGVVIPPVDTDVREFLMSQTVHYKEPLTQHNCVALAVEINTYSSSCLDFRV